MPSPHLPSQWLKYVVAVIGLALVCPGMFLVIQSHSMQQYQGLFLTMIGLVLFSASILSLYLQSRRNRANNHRGFELLPPNPQVPPSE